MLFIFGNAEARRSGHFPWTDAIQTALVLMLAGGVIFAGIALGTDLFSGRSAPAVQPDQQTQTGPTVKTAPKVKAPVALVIMDYPKGIWRNVEGFDPSTIPVEEGVYDGEYSWSSAKGAYAWELLPHLEGTSVAVAAARDKTNKNIVFMSLDADRYGPYLLLSVDGEKSLCRLNLLPITWEGQKTGGVTPESTRAKAQGEAIHLYGRYALGSGPSHLYWWEMVVQKSELPCS